MPPCSTHVHHRQTFPIQFRPDPRIFLVNILPMAQLLLHMLHTGNKNKRHIPVCHHPVQRPRFLDLKGTHQHLQLHWWHCHHNYHPAFWSLTQHSLHCFCLRWKMAGQNCSWQEMSHQNSGREDKFHEHNPIHVLQFFYRCFLLTVKPKQSQSQSIHFPGIALCLHLSSGGKTILFEMYLCSGIVTILVWGTVRGVPKIITFCPVQWKLLSCCSGIFVFQTKPLQGHRIK